LQLYLYIFMITGNISCLSANAELFDRYIGFMLGGLVLVLLLWFMCIHVSSHIVLMVDEEYISEP